MATVTVRRYVHRSAGHRPSRLEADDFELRDVYSPSVRLADVVHINTLITPSTGKAAYRRRRDELRLVTSYVENLPDGRMALLRQDFSDSALAMRVLVSEALGRGMLTAMASELFGWRSRADALADFDRLPLALATGYPKQGVRPDLLFDFGAGGPRMAGEARGRSRRPSRRPTRDQIDRFEDMLDWSHEQSGHPVVMTWANATEAGVTVDVFHGESSVFTPSPAIAPYAISGSAAEQLAIGGLAAEESGEALPERRRRQRRVDHADPEELIADARRVARGSALTLYHSAPEPERRQDLFGRQVRGGWTPLDPDDLTAGHLLLAIVDPGGPGLRRPRVVGGGDDDLTVAVHGPIVVAESRDRARRPPGWDRVRGMVEEHAGLDEE